MKTTVFQINEPDGTAHLVCVRMPSLQAACCLETRLKMHAGPNREVKLLGRFDAVHAALSQEEAEALVVGERARRPQPAHAMTLEEVVNRVLLRSQRP